MHIPLRSRFKSKNIILRLARFLALSQNILLSIYINKGRSTDQWMDRPIDHNRLSFMTGEEGGGCKCSEKAWGNISSSVKIQLIQSKGTGNVHSFLSYWLNDDIIMSYRVWTCPILFEHLNLVRIWIKQAVDFDRELIVNLIVGP